MSFLLFVVCLFEAQIFSENYTDRVRTHKKTMKCVYTNENNKMLLVACLCFFRCIIFLCVYFGSFVGWFHGSRCNTSDWIVFCERFSENLSSNVEVARCTRWMHRHVNAILLNNIWGFCSWFSSGEQFHGKYRCCSVLASTSCCFCCFFFFLFPCRWMHSFHFVSFSVLKLISLHVCIVNVAGIHMWIFRIFHALALCLAHSLRLVPIRLVCIRN